MTENDPRRVAPFGNPRINAWYAAPRGLSQLPHVLRRRFMPRHPPASLSSLGMFINNTCRNAFERDLDDSSHPDLQVDDLEVRARRDRSRLNP